jgi:hypothetical protein
MFRKYSHISDHNNQLITLTVSTLSEEHETIHRSYFNEKHERLRD